MVINNSSLCELQLYLGWVKQEAYAEILWGNALESDY
jgi:hypothetical protein